jgi:hypothetical protein
VQNNHLLFHQKSKVLHIASRLYAKGKDISEHALKLSYMVDSSEVYIMGKLLREKVENMPL